MNEATSEAPPSISTARYDRVVSKLLLLRTMGEITNSEVKRVISLIESPDWENWTVAEETVKNLLSFSK